MSPDRWLEELYSSACSLLGSPLFRSIDLAGLQQRWRQSALHAYRDIGPVILSVEIRRAHELAVFLTECKSIPQCDDSRLSV